MQPYIFLNYLINTIHVYCRNKNICYIMYYVVYNTQFMHIAIMFKIEIFN